MEQVIAYKANNGRLFLDPKKCEKYERDLAQYPKVKDTTEQLKWISIKKAEYVPVDIVKHIVSTWKTRYSRVNEKYFIVGGKYKFTGLMGDIESTLYSCSILEDPLEFNWWNAPRTFARYILTGGELDDKEVNAIIDSINKNTKHKVNKLSVEIKEKDRKWVIDNPAWQTGAVAPMTFSIERI